MTDVLDRLVADFIVTEAEHGKITQQAIERLMTDYPELTAKYGDWNLGLSFGGVGGRAVRADVHRALREKGMSLRQIAAETGVSLGTVHADLDERSEVNGSDLRERSEVNAPADDTPDDTPAGPHWAALGGVVKPLRGLTETPAADVAASVPGRRRASTAKALRRLGTYLGEIALELEGMSK